MMALEDEMRDVSTMLSTIAQLLDATNALLVELLRRMSQPAEGDDE